MPYRKWPVPHRQDPCATLARSCRMTPATGPLSRLLSAGVLAPRPAPAAVALGPTALRLLPWNRLSVFRLDDPRLAVTLGGVRLPNPLILAAMYYDPRILRRVMGLGFGAVTTKSITVEPRPGHAQPNLTRVRTAAGPGLVNCNGFQNPGLERFRAALTALPHRVPLIVSVAGESVDDYVALATRLRPLGDLVEVNISSPNTRLVYEWSRKPPELVALLRAVRAATDKPLIVKLSPDFTDANESQIIPAALEAGVPLGNYGHTPRRGDPRLPPPARGPSRPQLFPPTPATPPPPRARGR